jgi:hypothetical protein
MILLSELSRRRIRSINRLLRVGRNEVVMVRCARARGRARRRRGRAERVRAWLRSARLRAAGRPARARVYRRRRARSPSRR